MALTSVSPEIRLMIYRELIHSLLDESNCEYFPKDRYPDRPYYHLILRGTSPFTGYETVEKNPRSPWALLRVCKLIQREIKPFLDDLEPCIVWDFRCFTSDDLKAWGETAGAERVGQMRRWVLHGVRSCSELDCGVGSEEVEAQEVDSEDEEEDDRERYNEAFDENRMFHGYSVAADLELWTPKDEEREEVFVAHEWEIWDRGCESCFQAVDELLPDFTDEVAGQWDAAGEATTTVDLLSEVQSYIGWGLGPTREARENWRAFVARLHGGCFPTRAS